MHLYSRDHIFTYTDSTLRPLLTDEDKKSEGTLGEKDGIRIEIIEEIKDCQSLLVILQCGSLIPAVQHVLQSEVVEEMCMKAQRELKEKGEKNRGNRSVGVEEVCLLFKNLFGILRGQGVVKRSESFLNCIGFVNWTQDLKDGETGEAKPDQKTDLRLVELFLALINYLAQDEHSSLQHKHAQPKSQLEIDMSDKPKPDNLIFESILKQVKEEAETILKLFTFKNSYCTINLIEKFEACSIEVQNNNTLVALPMALSTHDTLAYMYPNGQSWSSLLTLTDLTDTLISKRLIPNLKYVLYNRLSNTILPNMMTLAKITNPNYDINLVPILIPSNISNPASLDGNRQLCKFSFTIINNKFHVFAHHKVLFSEVLSAASRIVDYFMNSYLKRSNPQSPTSEFYESEIFPNDLKNDCSQMTCGEIFLQHNMSLEKILAVSMSNQGMLSDILGLKLWIKFPKAAVHLNLGFASVSVDDNYSALAGQSAYNAFNNAIANPPKITVKAVTPSQDLFFADTPSFTNSPLSLLLGLLPRRPPLPRPGQGGRSQQGCVQAPPQIPVLLLLRPTDHEVTLLHSSPGGRAQGRHDDRCIH
jgi:hypothetical protein